MEAFLEDIISELEDITHAINKLIVRIQMLVTEIRQVPLKEELNRFNKLLRDISREYNKDVKLKLECGNTEIDHELSEVMSDIITAAIVSIYNEEVSPLGVLLQDRCENAIVGMDEVIGEDEILLKELEEESLNSQFIQGITVLGNGRIIVMLDPGAFL